MTVKQYTMSHCNCILFYLLSSIDAFCSWKLVSGTKCKSVPRASCRLQCWLQMYERTS